MTRIKVKKKEIFENKDYQLKPKCDKKPCGFHEIERYLDLMVRVNENIKSGDIYVHRYGKDKKCVWILFGQRGSEHVALQVGEVLLERAENEILCDIKYMYEDDKFLFNKMDDEDELMLIDTEFYYNTYAVKDVEAKRIYAYKKMREDFKELTIYQLRIDEYLGFENTKYESSESEKIKNALIQMAKSYYAESKLAYDTQALYWNTYGSGVGYESLQLVKKVHMGRK